jgi:haloalkane dehalogenase
MRLNQPLATAATMLSACHPPTTEPLNGPPPVAQTSTPSAAAAGDPKRTAVLDSFLAFREAGSVAEPTVVFLHGNPLSSRVWHGVVPIVAQRARCLSPDLIGMGDSGKPDIAYRYADHARYLDVWFDAQSLRNVVLVGYDWGGVLAMDWAVRHPDRVRGVVVFETFLRPLEWSDWSPRGAELFRALRTPAVGEKMVLEENGFLARSLSNGIRRPLAQDELAAYYAPYPTPASRRPLLQWPREIPIEGQPADVTRVVSRNGEWLASSDVPKLLLAFAAPEGLHPSPTGSPQLIEWARGHARGLEIVELPTAGHHAPEDRPEEIGGAIVAWMERTGATSAATGASHEDPSSSVDSSLGSTGGLERRLAREPCVLD